MKRISPTPCLPFSSWLLRPLPAPLSQHHCIKDILPMKIYPYLRYCCEINETDVNCNCNLQQVWDSAYSLNGNSCSLFIVIRSTIPGQFDLLRSVNQSWDKGASSWLTAVPLVDQGLVLNKQEFKLSAFKV